MLVSLLTGLLFGLVPALQLSRPQLVDHLKDRTNRTSGYGRLFALRNVLVMAQVALSLVTLVGAGLFLRSLQNAQRTDPGFDTTHLLLLSFDAGAEGYTGESAEAFQRTALDRVRALPTVKSAVLASSGLFDGGFSRTVFPEGVDQNDRRNGRLTPLNQVGPGYFETVGIPILRGRALAETDRAGAAHGGGGERDHGAPPLARPGAARQALPLLRRGLDHRGGRRGARREVLHDRRRPAALLLPAAVPAPLGRRHPARAHRRRSRGRPWARCAGRCNRSTPACPSRTCRPSAQLFDQALWAPRMSASLLGAFGALALVLAAIGVHGVVSYSVAERTQEFGIRMAMGARPVDMLRMVMRQTLLTASIGAAVALARRLRRDAGSGQPPHRRAGGRSRDLRRHARRDPRRRDGGQRLARLARLSNRPAGRPEIRLGPARDQKYRSRT